MPQIHIYLPPSRPNSVLKISSHAPPFWRGLGCPRLGYPRRCGSPFFAWPALGRWLRSRLLGRQLWSPSRAGSRRDRTGVGSERIGEVRQAGVAHARAEPEPGVIVLAAKPVPAETPPTSPATVKSTSPEAVNKIVDRHWQDANASLMPVAPPRRHARSKEPKQSAAKSPPSTRAEVWHCRQDAMGGLLRSLDLSPKCNL